MIRRSVRNGGDCMQHCPRTHTRDLISPRQTGQNICQCWRSRCKAQRLQLDTRQGKAWVTSIRPAGCCLCKKLVIARFFLALGNDRRPAGPPCPWIAVSSVCYGGSGTRFSPGSLWAAESWRGTLSPSCSDTASCQKWLLVEISVSWRRWCVSSSWLWLWCRRWTVAAARRRPRCCAHFAPRDRTQWRAVACLPRGPHDGFWALLWMGATICALKPNVHLFFCVQTHAMKLHNNWRRLIINYRQRSPVLS